MRRKMPRVGVSSTSGRLAHHNGTGYDNVQCCSRERSVFSHYLLLAVLNAMIAENVMSIYSACSLARKRSLHLRFHIEDRRVQKGNSRREIVISKFAPTSISVEDYTQVGGKRKGSSSRTNDMLVYIYICLDIYNSRAKFDDAIIGLSHPDWTSDVSSGCYDSLHRAWTVWDENRENGRWWIASAVCSLPHVDAITKYK